MSLVEIENAARGVSRTFVPGHENAARAPERDLPASAFHTPSSPVGPPFVERLIAGLGGEEAARVMHGLWAIANVEKRDRRMQGSIPFLTDASGNVTVKIFDVPAGYQFALTRCYVEIQGKDPGSVATAGAWLAAIEGEQGTTNVNYDAATRPVGQFRASSPDGAAGGLFLPTLLVDDSESAAWKYRSGAAVLIAIGGSVAGLANLHGFAHFSGLLQEVE